MFLILQSTYEKVMNADASVPSVNEETLQMFILKHNCVAGLKKISSL